MKRAWLAILLGLSSPAAFADDASGPGALALAAVVGDRDPALNATHRLALARLFAGQTNFGLPAGQKIVVKADKIVCRVHNVSIIERSCELKFGPHVVNLAGRSANELYATMSVAGVPSDGAAGTIFEGLHQLGCTVDPAVAVQGAGGGADCTFTPGP